MLFQRSSFNCKTVKVEKDSFQPGTGYFLQGTNISTNAIVSSSRTCHSCVSSLSICKSPKIDRIIEVEYVSMMMVANSSIVPNAEFCKGHRHDPVCLVSTQQEFLFKVYFKSRYPDLIFIHGTFAHDRMKPIQYIEKAIHHVIKVMQDTLPSSTKAVWFTSSSLDPSKRTRKDKQLRYEHGWTLEQKILECNRLLFNAIQTELKREDKAKMYGFFDLHSISSKMQPVWGHDDIHFKPIWYNYIIEYLFSILAEQDLV